MEIVGNIKNLTNKSSSDMQKVEVNKDSTLSIFGDGYIIELTIEETRDLVQVVMIESLSRGMKTLADSSGVKGLLSGIEGDI